jgi:hypothetical protein
VSVNCGAQNFNGMTPVQDHRHAGTKRPGTELHSVQRPVVEVAVPTVSNFAVSRSNASMLTDGTEPDTKPRWTYPATVIGDPECAAVPLAGLVTQSLHGAGSAPARPADVRKMPLTATITASASLTKRTVTAVLECRPMRIDIRLGLRATFAA